jgi:hypothetical protein
MENIVAVASMISTLSLSVKGRSEWMKNVLEKGEEREGELSAMLADVPVQSVEGMLHWVDRYNFAEELESRLPFWCVREVCDGSISSASCQKHINSVGIGDNLRPREDGDECYADNESVFDPESHEIRCQ